MNNRMPLVYLMVLCAMFLAGCASKQQQMTPEQEEMARQMQQAFIDRLKAGTSQMAAQQAQPPATEPVQKQLSEEELATQIRNVKGEGEPVTIDRVRDGLRIGGRSYLDPEGEIVNFSANALTGDIVYALKVNNRTLKLKYLSAAGGGEPVTIGTATNNDGKTSFRSVTGKTLSGNNIIGTSKGVLVTREGSAFHYVPGQPVTSTIVPEGYRVASLQKGDFGSTGYLLIEKIPAQKGSLSDLTDTFGSLGAAVGLSEADGYMLLNAETGDTVKLDISIDDKEVQVLTNCERQNDFVNKCSDMHSYESIYRQDGTRNRGHYFWRVDWMDTPEGAFAVVQEAGSRKINVIDLDSGDRVTIFERTLGIASHDVSQSPGGKIMVEAQLGFSKENIDDALQAFKQGLTQASVN
mgnify:CR=1 FL=1